MRQKLTVRLQADDLARLKDIAELSGLSVSEIVRAILNGSSLKTLRVDHKYNLDLIRQLNRIGYNINQIAKRANTKRSLDIEILHRLASIEYELKRLYSDQTGQSTRETVRL